jgi:hypothetical protein
MTNHLMYIPRCRIVCVQKSLGSLQFINVGFKVHNILAFRNRLSAPNQLGWFTPSDQIATNQRLTNENNEVFGGTCMCIYVCKTDNIFSLQCMLMRASQAI